MFQKRKKGNGVCEIYTTSLPILNILVPHSGHVPLTAGLPFFRVTCSGLTISRFVLHLTQYPVVAIFFVLMTRHKRLYHYLILVYKETAGCANCWIVWLELAHPTVTILSINYKRLVQMILIISTT